MSFDDGRETTLRTTPEYPFAVTIPEEGYESELGQGRVLNADVITIAKTFAWRSAEDLNIGDRVIGIDGRNGLITAKGPVGTLSTVHNFAVEVDHTYFVGNNAVWVHNQYKDAIENAESNPVVETE